MLERSQPRLCSIVPAAALLAFAAWCYVSFRPDFSWDDAEPEILNQAWRLARGDGIYRNIDGAPFAFAAIASRSSRSSASTGTAVTGTPRAAA